MSHDGVRASMGEVEAFLPPPCQLAQARAV